MAVFEILSFTLVFLVAWYVWKNRRFYYLACKIEPSSFDLSPKGIIKCLTGDNQTLFHMLREAFSKSKVAARTWLCLLYVGIVKLDDIKLVLNSKDCINKPYFVGFFNLSKGSLFGNVEYWQPHRKIMNPYFGTQGVRELVPIFNTKVKIMMKNIDAKANRGTFDVLHTLMALSLETILKVMEYDYELQTQSEEQRDEVVENLDIVMQLAVRRIWRTYLHPDIVYKLLGYKKIFIDAFAKSSFGAFSQTILKNIQEKVQQDENNNEPVSQSDKSKNFIRALVNPKNGFKNDELMDEISSMVAAAQDTSAVATSTTLLLLAMHKDIQAKVVEEFHRVLGKSKEPPFMDLDLLNQLEYTEMVFNESLRLIPTVPLVMRYNQKEITLSDGTILPTGTNIMVPIYEIHRSKEHWGADADCFRPTRFSKENMVNVHQYAFMPFSRGARMCIGWKYAMALMKIKLANILMKYEVDTELKLEELEFRVNITMNICQGYKITLTDRK